MSSITTRKTTAAVSVTESDAILIDDAGDRIDINSDGSLNVRMTQQSINLRRYNATLSATKDVSYQHINYIVPLGKKFTWLSGKGSSDCLAYWSISIDGVLYQFERNSYDTPNIIINLIEPIVLNAAQNLVVDVVNKSWFSTNSRIETWLFGSEENI